MRFLSLSLGVLSAVTISAAAAQTTGDGALLGATAFGATGSIKVFNVAGSVRLVGWDKDSVVVRGRVPRGQHFAFRRLGDASSALMMGMLDVGGEGDRPCDFVAYVPRRATVAVKTVTADIDGMDVSGWFYSASGAVHLRGAAASVDIQSINGSIDADVATGIVRAKTGDGHLLLRGSPQDADVSTISGTLDIAAPSLLRGQFASVSGDIHYTGSPLAGAIFEFSNHSGAVDLVLPGAASGIFTLSSVTGAIENGVSLVRPASNAPHSLRLALGKAASGAQVTVRTFKGTIRLRPQ